MRPFLESLAVHLIDTEGPRLWELRIILPSRRSCVFLRQYLAAHLGKVQWAPRISAISDFIQEISLLRSSDPVSSLFLCYDSYCKTVREPEPFETFYYWGEMMLRDFDELDKYLVDAELLFSNIVDLKELEEPLSGLGPEQQQFIRQFWEGFHAGEETPEKAKFLENWKRLPSIYQQLREALASGGEGYQGMQYREIAERAGLGELELSGTGKSVVAGFNALSTSEKIIFKWLKEQGCTFFWDYDHRYVDEEVDEAGRFMRENLKAFPPGAALERFEGLDQKKDIRIIELPSDILQAKTVHGILQQEGSGTLPGFNDTAVVLCDEELLMPVLTSLPEHVQDVNVTMGYPMRQTPAYTLVDVMVRLQQNARIERDGNIKFYYRDVTAILTHPYIMDSEEPRESGLMEEINRRNLVMVDPVIFTGELEMKIFRAPDREGGMLGYFRAVFLQLLEDRPEVAEGVHAAMDRESIFHLLRYLNRLENLLSDRSGITSGVVARLLQKMLGSHQIPFEGEPLSGLQVLGILETRLLDFRHVILLSMNEEVMPASHPAPSFIPYSLRLAYGLPAREDKDAIYAYYFYRLLQRAGKIDLLYNSASEGVRTGEMSRYLHQYHFEKDDVKMHRPALQIAARKVPPLEMLHGPEVEEKLSRYLDRGEKGRYLSPSALNSYLDCSLRFYFRYLAGIGEPDEVKEEIDAPGFGTVIHEAIRILYDQISRQYNGMVDPSVLRETARSEVPEKVLREVFLEHQFRGRKGISIEGRDIIVFRVMFRYLQRIMERDLERAPFEIIGLEGTYTRSLKIGSGSVEKEVLLGGKVDRLDRVGEILRVIDYKSGEAATQFPSVDSLFNTSLASRNGAAMQTLFYAWLVSPEFPGEQIMPGLYVMKALYGEDFDPALVMGARNMKSRVEDFGTLETSFIGHLKQLLEKLFDQEIPFVQTANRTKCRSCQFAAICSRESIE